MSEFAVIGLSIAIAFFLLKSIYNYRALPTLPLAATHVPPDLTVIIPARNEAHQIARAAASFPGVRTIVIDDASTDQTSAVARQAGAEVVSAPPLPAGAKGKPNACAAGARLATSQWILFVDADTWFDPPFAQSLVSYAEENQLDALSVFLRQHCETLAEHALLPYAFALYFTGVSAKRVNNPRSRECLANGQCLLFKRSAYQSIGGHDSVASSVIEDVALAAHAKANQLRLRVVRSENMGHVRMYDGFRSICRGFEKNSFRFLLINPASGIQVVIASILITSWLPVLALGYRDIPQGPGRLTFFLTSPSAILLVLPFLLLWPWYKNASTLLAPFGIYFFQLIALNGMIATITRRQSLWKGRRV